jgi:hypothetical protein
MTKLTSLLLIIIFFISLFVGIVIGVIVKPQDSTPTPTTKISSEPIEPIGIFLVLGVENFDDEVLSLESAWHVTINRTPLDGESYIEVVLVAKYPFAASQVTSTSQEIYLKQHPPIQFPRYYLDNLNSSELFNSIPVLNRSEIFFEHVIVLDEYAMNYIINLSNAKPQAPPPMSETTFCKPWDDPAHALSRQRNILVNLCSHQENILEYNNFMHVFELFPSHMKSTLSQEQIMDFWQEYVQPTPRPIIECKIYP